MSLTSMLAQFLWGALAMSSSVVALFFLRFFKDTGDRLFVFFAIAFGLLAAHWVGLAIANPVIEARHYFYVLRLAAFLVIIIGIVDKNRRVA